MVSNVLLHPSNHAFPFWLTRLFHCNQVYYKASHDAGGKSIGDIGQRINEYRSEKYLHASFLSPRIPQHTPLIISPVICIFSKKYPGPLSDPG
jgi:hypothetical protein